MKSRCEILALTDILTAVPEHREMPTDKRAGKCEQDRGERHLPLFAERQICERHHAFRRIDSMGTENAAGLDWTIPVNDAIGMHNTIGPALAKTGMILLWLACIQCIRRGVCFGLNEHQKVALALSLLLSSRSLV